MGFLVVVFFSSLTLSVTDSYLHWLTLRELAACWDRGLWRGWPGKLTVFQLVDGWRRKEAQTAHRHFSLQIDWKWWILLQCLGRDAWTLLCLFHKCVDGTSHYQYHPGCGEFFFDDINSCLHTPKAEIRIRWNQEGLLNKAFRRLNYWTNRDAYLQGGLMVLVQHRSRISHVLNYVFQLFVPAYNNGLRSFLNNTVIS